MEYRLVFEQQISIRDPRLFKRWQNIPCKLLKKTTDDENYKITEKLKKLQKWKLQITTI